MNVEVGLEVGAVDMSEGELARPQIVLNMKVLLRNVTEDLDISGAIHRQAHHVRRNLYEGVHRAQLQWCPFEVVGDVRKRVVARTTDVEARCEGGKVGVVGDREIHYVFHCFSQSVYHVGGKNVQCRAGIDDNVW